MNNPFVPRVGAVFSADIAVPEHGREVRFYSRVLSTGANPLWWEEDLMNNLGMPIIGLGALSEENMLTFHANGCRTFRSPMWPRACSVPSIGAGVP
jgi:hypothetical protein